jgi:hypothetical protein
MAVPSMGFIAGPDVLKEEAALSRKKVNGWSRSRKLKAFAQGADRISKTLKSFPPALWKFKPSIEKMVRRRNSVALGGSGSQSLRAFA